MSNIGADIPRARSGLRILIVNDSLPRPDVAAGDRRLAAILQILGERHEIHLWCEKRAGSEGRSTERYESDLEAIGIYLHPVDLELVDAASTVVYDVVIFEFWHRAESSISAFKKIQPWAYTIVDSVDVHFIREEAGLPLGIDRALEVESRKVREIATYRLVDCVVVVTPEDRQALDAVGEVRRLVEIPLIVVTRPRPVLSRSSSLLFVGGFLHLPNVDGIQWFVREVFPLVRRVVLDVHLVIVGSNPTPEIRALGETAGVQFIGYVPDTAPYLDLASVSVAPLRFGGGMKGKVTDAMAAGVPVVTTPVGIQGLGVCPGHDVLVGDSAQRFADHVVALLENPPDAEEIGLNGQRFVEARFGVTAVASLLEGLLNGTEVRRAPFGTSLRLRFNVLRTALRRTAGRLYREAGLEPVGCWISRLRRR